MTRAIKAIHDTEISVKMSSLFEMAHFHRNFLAEEKPRGEMNDENGSYQSKLKRKET